MAFLVVPFMFVWNLYGNFMIKQEMFKVEGPYQSSTTGRSGAPPIIADPCAEGGCIPGTIINGTIANHTVTIKEDENGRVVISYDDDEPHEYNNETGTSPVEIKHTGISYDHGHIKIDNTVHDSSWLTDPDLARKIGFGVPSFPKIDIDNDFGPKFKYKFAIFGYQAASPYTNMEVPTAKECGLDQGY